MGRAVGIIRAKQAALILTLAMITALTGCGFQPVYSTRGSGIGPIEITTIDGRTGYFLRQELERRAVLEQGSQAPRQLTVKLSRSFTRAAQGVDGISLRNELTVNAVYTLSAAPPLPAIRGTITASVAYESLDQAYGDVALQSDAEERIAGQLAQRMWLDLQRQLRSAR
jgi:LPS-assembly lipoprotein